MRSTVFTWGIVVAAGLSACATAPSASDFEGEEDVWVMSTQLVPLEPEGGASSWTKIEPLEGASCTLSNNRGRWPATTPMRIRVGLSRESLVAECTKEGFEPLRQEFACVPPERGLSTSDAVDVAALAFLTPLAIVAGPVGIAQLGGPILVRGASLAHSQATAPPRRHGCSYFAVEVQMRLVATGGGR
jgi:hypothetical protein